MKAHAVPLFFARPQTGALSSVTGIPASGYCNSPKELRGELGVSVLLPHTTRQLSEKTSALTIPHLTFFSVLFIPVHFTHIPSLCQDFHLFSCKFPFFDFFWFYWNVFQYCHSFRVSFVEFDKKGLFKVPDGCIIITSHFSTKNI